MACMPPVKHCLTHNRFWWAYFQMFELKSLQSTKASHVKRALKTLPFSLNETYERLPRRISSQLTNEAAFLLKWLTFSRQSLTLIELAEVSIVDPYPDECGNSVHIGDRGSPKDALEFSQAWSLLRKQMKVRH